MTKFTTGFLLAVLVLTGKASWAEEENREHKKNISKAVSAQLLRMKLKKMNKTKANKESKISSENVDLKVEDAKPVATQGKSEPVAEKKSVSTVKEAVKKSEKAQEKQAGAGAGVKEKRPSSQQKNDNLRLRLQDLVNSAPDD